MFVGGRWGFFCGFFFFFFFFLGGCFAFCGVFKIIIILFLFVCFVYDL